MNFLYNIILMKNVCLLAGSPRPSIVPSWPHLVIPLNGPVTLRCLGQQTVQWLREDKLKVRGEQRSAGLSVLHIHRAQPVHMGRYICLEEGSGEQSSVYVYVKGTFNLELGH